MVRYALSLSALFVLVGCGSSASSTRQVLPGFPVSELHDKTLVIAPLNREVAKSAFPIAKEDRDAVSAATNESDATLALLIDFHDAASRRANELLPRSELELAPLPEGAHSHPLARDPKQFISVSVDGTTRFDVPRAALLDALDIPADYCIVLTDITVQLSIETTTTEHATHTRRQATASTKFLVWDNAGRRALASGEVEARGSFGADGDVTRETWREMGAATLEEILAKPPFQPM